MNINELSDKKLREYLIASKKDQEERETPGNAKLHQDKLNIHKLRRRRSGQNQAYKNLRKENMDELELTDETETFLNLLKDEELNEEELDAIFNELDEESQEQILTIFEMWDEQELHEDEEGGDQPTEYKPVHDLVTHAINQAPVDFQRTFDNLLASKLEDAVAERKLELAQDLFSDNPVEIEEPTEEPQVDDAVEAQVDNVEEPVEEEIEELDEKNKPWLRHENPPGQHAKDFNNLLSNVLGKYKKSPSNSTVLKPKSGPSAASASTKG